MSTSSASAADAAGAAARPDPARPDPARPDPDPDRADTVLRALADPQRRQILHLVRGGELAAGQIAAHFDATQQAVSHHLQVLQRAGLLQERRAGTRRLYALNPEALNPVREVLTDLWPAALDRLKQAVESRHPRDTPQAGADS